MSLAVILSNLLLITINDPIAWWLTRPGTGLHRGSSLACLLPLEFIINAAYSDMASFLSLLNVSHCHIITSATNRYCWNSRPGQILKVTDDHFSPSCTLCSSSPLLDTQVKSGVQFQLLSFNFIAWWLVCGMVITTYEGQARCSISQMVLARHPVTSGTPCHCYLQK